MLRAFAAEDRAAPTVEHVPAALMPRVHIKDATPPAELFPPLDRKRGIQFAWGQSVFSLQSQKLLTTFPETNKIIIFKKALKAENVFTDAACTVLHMTSISDKNNFLWSPQSPEYLKACKFKCEYQGQVPACLKNLNGDLGLHHIAKMGLVYIKTPMLGQQKCCEKKVL